MKSEVGKFLQAWQILDEWTIARTHAIWVLKPKCMFTALNPFTPMI